LAADLATASAPQKVDVEVTVKLEGDPSVPVNLNLDGEQIAEGIAAPLAVYQARLLEHYQGKRVSAEAVVEADIAGLLPFAVRE